MRARTIRWTLPLVLAGALAAGAVLAATGSARSSMATVDVHMTTALGNVLAGPNGHTLYRYTVDSKGVNRCSAVSACNAYWPALLVKKGTMPTAGAGVSAHLLGTIAAKHGMVQVTYGGYPLYYFSGDKAAGQTNGQGFQSKWYGVSSSGALVKHAVKSSGSGGTSTGSSGSGGTTTSGGTWA